MWVTVELEDHYKYLPFVVIDRILQQMEYSLMKRGEKAICITEPEFSNDYLAYHITMYGKSILPFYNQLEDGLDG